MLLCRIINSCPSDRRNQKMTKKLLLVLDRKGYLRHDGGVVDAPGLYAIGLPVLRRRKSSFIYGAEDDARDLIAHLAGYLAGASPSR
jgi:hypothetical protein